MTKEATQLGNVSVNKPAWRLMLDAAIDIMNSVRESSVHLIVKGITIVSIIAIFTAGSVYALIIAPGTSVGDGITFLGACVIALSIIIWMNE